MAYAGDLGPTEAWEMLRAEVSAQLIDVRTVPEWNFVGVPDLDSVGKKPMLIAWQVYPAMHLNPSFIDEIRRLAPQRDTPLLFICRSGTRSRAAAEAMTAVGYRRCYNIAGGFEGQVDAERHRGCKAGWKAVGLPWTQD
jgi:rhodanese-related sulfurtransferase